MVESSIQVKEPDFAWSSAKDVVDVFGAPAPFARTPVTFVESVTVELFIVIIHPFIFDVNVEVP